VHYTLKNAPGVKETLKELENGDANAQRKLEKVRRALGRLQQNPRHPGLNSYEYQNFPGVPRGTKVWHSYVETTLHQPGGSGGCTAPARALSPSF